MLTMRRKRNASSGQVGQVSMSLVLLAKLLWRLKAMQGREHWTRPQLLAYQAEQVSRVRAYALAHSPFYRRFHQGLAARPLTELPVLTKSLLMDHFDELVTDRAIRLAGIRDFAAHGRPGARYLGRYHVSATSGSSGQPGFFIFDQNEWLNVMASFARGQAWSRLGIGFQRLRMATVASVSPWHVSSQVALSARSWLRPSLRLAASAPLPVLVAKLNAWQPDLLIAYASMAGILAQEQLSGRLRVRPRAVFTSSEVLTPRIRASVRQAWGDEPLNQYGATEAADIAAEHHACRHMHFFEDLVLAEVVDEHYRPIGPGEYGAKILVTNLFNRSQPLIRYELNDSVRLEASRHDCGLPFAVLGDLQGRVEEALHLPAVDGGTITVQPLVFNRVMDVAPVVGWQINQQADGGLIVLVTGSPGAAFGETLSQQLALSLSQVGASAPYIKTQLVNELPKAPSGKTPLIKRYHV